MTTHEVYVRFRRLGIVGGFVVLARTRGWKRAVRVAELKSARAGFEVLEAKLFKTQIAGALRRDSKQIPPQNRDQRRVNGGGGPRASRLGAKRKTACKNAARALEQLKSALSILGA